jgi:hypothetical protein
MKVQETRTEYRGGGGRVFTSTRVISVSSLDEAIAGAEEVDGATATSDWTAFAASGSGDELVATIIAKVALTDLDTGGGVLSWQNPEGVDIAITGFVIDIETASDGAGTVDFGTTTVSSTTSSDNLVDGLSVAATGLFNNNDDKGANGKTRERLAAGKWVTGSKASGSAAGVEGYAYIHYNRLS